MRNLAPSTIIDRDKSSEKIKPNQFINKNLFDLLREANDLVKKRI